MYIGGQKMNRLIKMDEIKNIELKNPLKKKKINPLVVGAAGIAVGAGVAAAISLKINKKLRKKVQVLVGDIKDQAVNYVSEIKNKPEINKNSKKTKIVKAKNK